MPRVAPNVDKFLVCRGRVNDLYEYNGDVIRSKKTVRGAANIFSDMKWMIEEVNRLPGSEALIELKRFSHIAKQVELICKERAAAIKTGQFVDMSAEVFSRYRFLVRELEKVILKIMKDQDMDTDRITGEKLADEDNTVKISLTDPDDPGDDDDKDDADDKDKTPLEKGKK